MAENVPIQKKDFVALELLRLTTLINQTDPRTAEYGRLLENIERFACAATMFDDLWSIFSAYYDDQGMKFNNDSPVADEGKGPEVIKPFQVVTAEEHADEAPVSEEPDSPIPEEPEMFEPVKEEPKAEEAPAYDAAAVKKAIGKARADGKLTKIKDWLMENFGVEGFSALPTAKYGEAMELLKAMGVDV